MLIFSNNYRNRYGIMKCGYLNIVDCEKLLKSEESSFLLFFFESHRISSIHSRYLYFSRILFSNIKNLS